jgi:hypothetical protein
MNLPCMAQVIAVAQHVTDDSDKQVLLVIAALQASNIHKNNVLTSHPLLSQVAKNTNVKD